MRRASTGLAVALATTAIALSAARAGDLQVTVLDRAAAPLANAIVYAVPAVPIAHGKLPTAVVDQIHRQFAPQVSVIQAGTPVDFPNSDNIRHSVYSFSPAKVFKLKLYAGKAAPPVIFDKPGLVVLGCEIHDPMVAWVLVVDTPYYGKTSAAGLVTLRGLRPGDYSLRAWHVPMRQPTDAGSLHVGSGIPLPAVTIRLDASNAPAQGQPMPMSMSDPMTMAGMSH